MDRVVEQTVTWHYKGQTKRHTVRYITAAEDRFNNRAETVSATQLQQADLDAIEEYRKACEEGKAIIVGRPERRRVE